RGVCRWISREGRHPCPPPRPAGKPDENAWLMDGPVLRSITVADPAEPWQAAGFAVDDNRAQVGAVELLLVGEGGGITSWAVEGAEAGEVDGLATRGADGGASEPEPGVHPNLATSLDHLVITSHDVERTVAALTGR